MEWINRVYWWYVLYVIVASTILVEILKYFKNSKRNKIIDSIRDKIRNNEIYCKECKYFVYTDSFYCLKYKIIIGKQNSNNDCKDFWPK